jgi:hypothetical protein
MSVRIDFEPQITTIVRTGDKYQEVYVCQDGHGETLPFPDGFPEDNLELLASCCRKAKEDDNYDEVLWNIFEIILPLERGVYIRGEFHPFEKIKEVVQKNWKDYDPDE